MRLRRARALSLLLEMIVGLAILAGGILVAMALFPTAYASLSQAKNLSLANNLARQVLEQQKSRGYSAVRPIGSSSVELPVEINGNVVIQKFLYRSGLTLPPDRSYKGLDVVVSWTVSGVTRTCRLDTVVLPR